MVRRNVRAALEVLGRDGRNSEEGETLILERRDPRIGVGASCRKYAYVQNLSLVVELMGRVHACLYFYRQSLLQLSG
jgi:hypothetical protein